MLFYQKRRLFVTFSLLLATPFSLPQNLVDIVFWFRVVRYFLLQGQAYLSVVRNGG